VTSEEKIAELEEVIRKLNLDKLQGNQNMTSRHGNTYWNHVSDRHPITRPYDGNDRQFVSVFADVRYADFLKASPHLQDYWRAPMYLVDRKPDGYREACSNIHRGDFFGCGNTKQVGQVYRKITNIQCGLSPEHQKPSPAGPGGIYITYSIGGDIGGHWSEPTHDGFTLTNHFLWLPTPDRLLFAGFPVEAETLWHLIVDILK
jgi:hypothetical protein